MTRSHMHAAIFCAALAPSAVALAQQDLAVAQQRYERALAYCNNGSLPRPERDACVRDAGNAWDRARGGFSPTDDSDVTSPGGRATVIVPDGSPPPLSDSQTVISPDGRSTIVLPAGGARPMPNQ